MTNDLPLTLNFPHSHLRMERNCWATRSSQGLYVTPERGEWSEHLYKNTDMRENRCQRAEYCGHFIYNRILSQC